MELDNKEMQEETFNTYMYIIENYNKFYIKYIYETDGETETKFLKLEELGHSLNLMLFSKKFIILNLPFKIIKRLSTKIDNIKKIKNLSQKIKKWEDILELIYIYAIKKTECNIIIRNIPQITKKGIIIDEETIYDTLTKYFDTSDIQSVHKISNTVYLIETPSKEIAISVMDLINGNIIEGNVIKSKLINPIITSINEEFTNGINGVDIMNLLAVRNYNNTIQSNEESNYFELGIYYMYSSFNNEIPFMEKSLHDLYNKRIIEEIENDKSNQSYFTSSKCSGILGLAVSTFFLMYSIYTSYIFYTSNFL